MKLRIIISIVLGALLAGHCRAAEGRIDILNYFLPSEKIAAHDTIGGFNAHPCPDPDGAGGQSLILHKNSSPFNYEVYQLTPTQLLLRYEVVRSDSHGSSHDWIRRYHELSDGVAPKAGMLWMPRYVTPGKTTFISSAAVDRYDFDPSIGAYIIKPSQSSADAISYNTVVWSSDPWHFNNHTGLPITSVIRLICQWQHDGQIYETYDYAKGLGLINWQWMERVSTLTPVTGDKTGKLFNCENGAIYLQSHGDKLHPPSVLQYELKHHRIGGPLPVIAFKSQWDTHAGPQWYVVYRDLSREGELTRKSKSLGSSFELPEWRTHHKATLADLPAFYTKP